MIVFQVRSSVERKLGKFDMYKAIEFDETQGMITKHNVRVSIHFSSIYCQVFLINCLGPNIK